MRFITEIYGWMIVKRAMFETKYPKREQIASFQSHRKLLIFKTYALIFNNKINILNHRTIKTQLHE